MAIGLGSLIIFYLMQMVGVAGVKTDSSSSIPVFARTSFGIPGANVPGIVCAIVACFGYDLHTAASGAVLRRLIRNENLL